MTALSLPPKPLVVGIGGTIGGASSTERALKIALDAAAAEGFATRMFGGADMARLPLYDPKATARTEHEQEFVGCVRQASALIIASPGYHGSISGVVKNALDLLEETARDPRPYLEDLPVGLIATAYGWQATGSTIAALRSIVHALARLADAVRRRDQQPRDQIRRRRRRQRPRRGGATPSRRPTGGQVRAAGEGIGI